MITDLECDIYDANDGYFCYRNATDCDLISGVVEKAETFYANYNADISSEYSISSRDAFVSNVICSLTMSIIDCN